MALARLCKECGASLAGKSPQAITCSDKCRQKRRRRVARVNKTRQAMEAEGGMHAEVARIVTDDRGAITEVVSDELRPIVREAIDDDVMRAIHALLDLTPKAVAVLGDELEATTHTRDGEEIPDQGRRVRAAQTVMKYTVGHPALAPERASGSGLTVINAIPSPDPNAAPATVDVAPEEAEEMRTCDICGEEKPRSEFVADSDRCGQCFHDWRKAALAKFHLDGEPAA